MVHDPSLPTLLAQTGSEGRQRSAGYPVQPAAGGHGWQADQRPFENICAIIVWWARTWTS